MANVSLPRFIVLQEQDNGNYMRYVSEDGPGFQYVQFSGDNVANSDAKFEVHVSAVNPNLVHLRSCYNNRYLGVDKTNWICARANEPEEDRTKRSCTLLEPTLVAGNPRRIRLKHVFLGRIILSNDPAIPQFVGYLLALNLGNSDNENFCHVFNVVDWNSLVILPRYIVFKGDNNMYLQAHWQDRHEYHQFSLSHVANAPTRAGHEVFPNGDGTIRIKNLHWGKFWRRSPNWIWADSSDTTSNNRDTVFDPVKLNDNTIALRNMGNNNFCTRLTTEGKTSCLNANSSDINLWARLEVSEFVVSSRVENVRFRLMDARTYDEKVLIMASDVIVNRGTNTSEHTVDLSHTRSRCTSWNSSVSLRLSYKVSFNVGIPCVSSTGVEITAEIAGSHKWGETTTEKTTISRNHKVFVPPMTRMTVRFVATQASCDVPFSYTRRDVLYTGETVFSQMDDGVFTGVNSFNAHIESSLEPLVSDHNVAPAEFETNADAEPTSSNSYVRPNMISPLLLEFILFVCVCLLLNIISQWLYH